MKVSKSDIEVVFTQRGGIRTRMLASMQLIAAKEMEERWPLTWAYLRENKPVLESREEGKMRGEKWFAYIYPKALDVMSLPKVFTPDLAARASFSFDQRGDRFFTGGAAGGYGVLAAPGVNPKYLLGLLNSKLLDWYLKRVTTTFRGGYYSYESRFISQLPIRTIKPSERADKARHDRLVELVGAMLRLRTDKADAKSDADRELIQRQVDETGREIDGLVYDLYALTEDERRLVEAAG